MKALRNLLDKVEPTFKEGGKLEKLYPVYEAIDTFLYTPGEVTKTTSHVRDHLDLKRMMTTVIIALTPCIFMAFYNTGLQAHGAIQAGNGVAFDDWRNAVMTSLGFTLGEAGFFSNLLYGALFFLPAYIVTMAVGGALEAVFSIVRRHEINEGFLVTGMLFPLTLPPTIPLWQVAVGISFGVVVGKEIFGGTGKNFLNPALTARAFLYFAYPAQISGDAVWTATDGYSGATPLGAIATAPVETAMEGMGAVMGLDGATGVTWMESFLGTVQGSMGETSTLACLIGALILILMGIGSWRIMAGVGIGTYAFALLLNTIGSDSNPVFALPAHWHLVIGGVAFGAVFMATDPVSAAFTNTGKWVYGVLIGAMTVLIRVINPAFPEGIMLAILFGNVMAPLIDYFVLQANIKRRMTRAA